DETMEGLAKLDAGAKRQIRENEESAAAAAETLKRASATELNSIQQRAMALDELARKHIADVERSVAKLLEAETSTAEGLRDFEQQMEGRRTEIETILDDRTTALTQHVEALEAFAVAASRRRDERRRENGPASRERDGRPAPAPAPASAPAPAPAPAPSAVDGGASRGPTRDAPASTPDLRGDR